jgi:hypothetical protein
MPNESAILGKKLKYVSGRVFTSTSLHLSDHVYVDEDTLEIVTGIGFDGDFRSGKKYYSFSSRQKRIGGALYKYNKPYTYRGSYPYLLEYRREEYKVHNYCKNQSHVKFSL